MQRWTIHYTLLNKECSTRTRLEPANGEAAKNSQERYKQMNVPTWKRNKLRKSMRNQDDSVELEGRVKCEMCLSVSCSHTGARLLDYLVG